MSDDQPAKPKKKRSEKRKRTALVVTRHTPQEKAAMVAAAERAGADLSAFIRLQTIGQAGARTRAIRPSPDLAAWAEWRAQLGYIGNNLNQLTRLANMGDLDRPAELDRVLAEVSALIAEARTVMRPEP